ncbi:MAG: exodeoxyribonuclease V subunit alpha [Desulfobulbaceae bacterium]|nr:exodeoxyribonuclease V subunit alpha [Desulfobulbaceae bacterium]HIJ77833.1 exodeoxyribonuclease V subunit alpha [Deltaproteobacteria bacterium]
MISIIEKLISLQRLDHFDRYFVRLLQQLDPDAGPMVLLLTAFARKAVSAGHVCVELASLAKTPILAGEEENRAVHEWWPPLAEMEEALAESRLIGDGREVTPLVYEQGRLYLHRYWTYEQGLAEAILARADDADLAVDQELVAADLAQVFADQQGRINKEQYQACLQAAKKQLLIISGGPGTGKTTVVVRILSQLLIQAKRTGAHRPRIILLAPTGKAAARLTESIRQRKNDLLIAPEIKEEIPEQASTIHRALGYNPQKPTSFRHNRHNYLDGDIVIVDEASMVDMALMAKLFEAVSPLAKLILLGDKNQLASVEAGSILGDICSVVAADASTQPAAFPLADCVVSLSKSFRFALDRGIGSFAGAVEAGDIAQALAVLHDPAQPEISLLAADDQAAHSAGIDALILAGYQEMLTAGSPLAALENLSKFRVLCAHRRGPGGVGHFNLLTEKILKGQGLISLDNIWYQGRPILITANDYKLRLFNGDTGVVWPDAVDGTLKVFFPGSAPDSLRAFPPMRLPAHETAFAMTIHKSQGSEFDMVMLVLPNQESAVLTRELLYTGVTRAREQVVIVGSDQLVESALNRRVNRVSGLGERIMAD